MFSNKELAELETRLSQIETDVRALTASMREVGNRVAFPAPHSKRAGMENCNSHIYVRSSDTQHLVYCRKVKHHQGSHMTMLQGMEIEFN